jgi:glycosyltransferase involved in cell wall biosynthesis
MGQDTAVTTRSIGRDNLAESRAVSPFGVLLVGNFLSAARPGSCTVCELLAARLSSAGWPVLTTSDKSARLSRLADMLITVWRRRKAYAVAQVDVYSGLSFVWAESVCWLLTRLGKPFVLTLHGGNLPAFAERWPGRVRRLLNSASVVTTPSGYLQQSLSAYRDGLVLLPNAIDLNSYPFRLRSNAQPKLIWLRALQRIYNPCIAPCAVAELVREFPEIQLTMFGPDKGDGSLDQVKSEVRRLNLEGRVSVPGAVPKTGVPKALNSGDIFLNTTNIDNTPVSLIEAMACGLCIVSTKAGGVPFLVDDGHDGLLVQADDSAGMAAAVRRILREPGLAERLSRNARAKAEQFDWAAVLPRWERLLGGARLSNAPVKCI